MRERSSPKSRVVIVSGTGTGIGKTHASEALLRAVSARGLTTAGLKPIESGLREDVASDAERLCRASTFHVKPAPYGFTAPLSPHLASRDAGGLPIRIDVVVDFVRSAQREVDLALVELPGGLFSPVTDSLVNADVARALAGDRLLLVAPDRLGVLHDVLAAARAASPIPLRIDGVILVAPETPDASTGRNAAELRRLLPLILVAELARGGVDDLAEGACIRELAALLVRGGAPWIPVDSIG